jgi:hypothetical protein
MVAVLNAFTRFRVLARDEGGFDRGRRCGAVESEPKR